VPVAETIASSRTCGPRARKRGTALAAAFSPNGRWVAFALERSVSYGPGFADSQKLMKVSVASDKTVRLTITGVGGFNPTGQPRR
jgi:hypothetical protein